MLSVFMIRKKPVFLVFLFYSFYCPQIVYNVVSGTRKALSPLYLIGTSISRLFFPLYIFGCPNNFIYLLLVEDASVFQVSPLTCYVLISWQFTQVAILLAQDAFGARFMVPKRYVPVRYDYYRDVPVPSSAQQSGTEIEAGIDCSICLSTIDLHDNRAQFMLTQCDHVFHTSCLRSWMAVKLQCPTCRAALVVEDS